jgi:GNAT superfamily N-acetyltransferase
MSQIDVRAVRAADERVILELARQEMAAQEAMDPRFRLRPDAMDRYAVYLRDRVLDMDSSVFVAELDGDVCGVVIGSIRRQETLFRLRRYGYVSDLMVARSARRRGVGQRLYDRVALWLRGLGVDVLRLHVAAHSEDARAFWKSLGASDFLTEAWIDLEPAVPAGRAGETQPADAGDGGPDPDDGEPASGEADADAPSLEPGAAGPQSRSGGAA